VNSELERAGTDEMAQVCRYRTSRTFDAPAAIAPSEEDVQVRRRNHFRVSRARARLREGNWRGY
jgi:hypothetical protein